MKEHIVNLASPPEVVKAIFHDNNEIVNEFSKKYPEEIIKFSELYSTAYKKYLELNRLTTNTENTQIAHVTAFTCLMLDNLLLSLKLFVLGYTIPSGNLMRQVVETVALTALCSLNEEITIRKNKKNINIHFYKHFYNKMPDAKSHLAMKYLEGNLKLMRINNDAFQVLRRSQNFYNNYSHPTELGLATIISFASRGKTYICGSFDEGKIGEYSKELHERINFCKIMPNIVEGLINNVKKLPNKTIKWGS